MVGKAVPSSSLVHTLRVDSSFFFLDSRASSPSDCARADVGKTSASRSSAASSLVSGLIGSPRRFYRGRPRESSRWAWNSSAPAAIMSRGRGTPVRWALRLGNLYGIAIRLHVTFLLLLAFLFLMATLAGGWRSGLRRLPLLGLGFVCV